MKHYSTIALIVLAAVSLSCGKQIDNIRPKHAIFADQLTEGDLSKLTNGARNQMENLTVTAWFNGDFLAEDFEDGPGFSYSDVHATTQSPSSSMALSIWQSAFQKLATVNELLAAANKATGESAAVREAKGNAYFFRAWTYYILVQRYGGVPILREATTSVVPISPEGQVWDLIESDLTESLNYLDEFTSIYYPSKEAAWAFLAKVCLWRGKKSEAATWAGKVIDSGKFALEDTSEGFAKMFINGTSTREAVFMLANNRTTDFRDIFSNVNDTDASWSYSPAAKCYQNLYSALTAKSGDIRAAATFSPDDAMRLIKFPNGRSDAHQFVDNPNPMASPLMMWRLADMYLVKAEAEGPSAGLATLKAFMEKRYATVNLPDSMSEGDFQNLVLDENHREFYGEGRRWFDIKRTGRTDLYDSWDGRDFLLYWPIPQDERDIAGHDNYPQNPGYSE